MEDAGIGDPAIGADRYPICFASINEDAYLRACRDVDLTVAPGDEMQNSWKLLRKYTPSAVVPRSRSQLPP
jgi:hypothetical protein